MEQTRRRFLAASAAVGAGSVAGCNAVKDAVPFVGGGVGNYREWIYSPDTFADFEEEEGSSDSSEADFSAVAVNHEEIYANRQEMFPETYDSLDSLVSRLAPATGILPRDVSLLLTLPEGVVVSGSFETSEVTAELEDDSNTEYESDGEYENYEVFVEAGDGESSTAVAVGEGTVVQGERVEPPFGSDADPVPATDVVEGIIDTRNGNGTRYADDHDGFATLVDTLDAGTLLSVAAREEPVGSDEADVEEGRFEGQVASGGSYAIGGDTTQIESAVVFDSEGDVNVGDVEDYVEANDNSGQFARYRNVEIEQSGRAVTISAEVDTYEYRSFTGDA